MRNSAKEQPDSLRRLRRETHCTPDPAPRSAGDSAPCGEKNQAVAFTMPCAPRRVHPRLTPAFGGPGGGKRGLNPAEGGTRPHMCKTGEQSLCHGDAGGKSVRSVLPLCGQGERIAARRRCILFGSSLDVARLRPRSARNLFNASALSPRHLLCSVSQARSPPILPCQTNLALRASDATSPTIGGCLFRREEPGRRPVVEGIQRRRSRTAGVPFRPLSSWHSAAVPRNLCQQEPRDYAFAQCPIWVAEVGEKKPGFRQDNRMDRIIQSW